jgi:5-methyltetrahydropteroyltriglutamate--homocysteine methyltransferase
MLNPEPSIEEYHRFARTRIAALNHGLAGLHEDRVRYQTCWGSWERLHMTDIPFRDLVDVLLQLGWRLLR